MLGDKVKPATKGQEELVEALKSDEYDVVGVFGPTGTGKSLLAIAYGISAIMEGEYQRFLICKPLIDVVSGREIQVADIGSETYTRMASAYMQDILSGFMSWGDVEKLMRENKVIFVDTHFLRGRTFDNSVIFLDDAQSIQPESACEILMRIGHDAKFIVAGDPVFQRVPGVEGDGATLIRDILMSEPKAKVIDLGLKDIVRPGAKRGIRLLLETKMRKRRLSESELKILESARLNAPDADIVTVIEFREDKERYEIRGEHVPDALIIVKEGHLGRIIGKEGERIKKIEEETQLRLRTIEMQLDFRNWIRAIHPVSWVYKYIVDVDFAGPMLAVSVDSEGLGPFVGQRGYHVKFVDSIFRKLIGLGVKTYEVAEEKPAKKTRKK